MADVSAARDHVEGVGDHAAGEKRLAVRVEIETPGIAGAVGKEVELLVADVIAPDRGVHLHVADFAAREYAVQPVQPAVRPPLERIERLMRILAAEAREQDLLLVAVPFALCVLQEE